MLPTKKNVTLVRRREVAFAAMVVLIIVLRETDAIDLNLYHHQSHCRINSSIQESSLTTSFDSTCMERIPHENITNTPIVVLDGNDTVFYRRGYGRAIELTFENLDTGPIWQPLYKPGSLRAELRCRYNGGWTKRQGSHITGIDMKFSGNMHVVGTVTIIGPCSYRTSLNLLKQAAANIAVGNIENRLRELEDAFESPSNPVLVASHLFGH